MAPFEWVLSNIWSIGAIIVPVIGGLFWFRSSHEKPFNKLRDSLRFAANLIFVFSSIVVVFLIRLSLNLSKDVINYPIVDNKDILSVANDPNLQYYLVQLVKLSKDNANLIDIIIIVNALIWAILLIMFVIDSLFNDA